MNQVSDSGHDTRHLERLSIAELQTKLQECYDLEERRLLRAAIRNAKLLGLEPPAELFSATARSSQESESTVCAVSCGADWALVHEDVSRIESEEQLRNLLYSTSDYEEKKKIRAAIRELRRKKDASAVGDNPCTSGNSTSVTSAIVSPTSTGSCDSEPPNSTPCAEAQPQATVGEVAAGGEQPCVSKVRQRPERLGPKQDLAPDDLMRVLPEEGHSKMKINGISSCHAQDQNGDSQRPTITRPLEDTKSMDGSHSVVLSVSFHSHPGSTSVFWYKDDELLITSDDFEQKVSDTSSQLVIKELFPDDAGVYKCVVQDAYGKAESSARLAVEENPSFRPPHFVVIPKEVSVEAGGSLEVHVEVTGSPEPQLYWFKGDRHLKNGKEFRQTFNAGMGTLLIYEVFPDDGGVYKCLASNAAGECEACFYVRVAARHVPNYSSPRLSRNLEDLTVPDGASSVTMTCALESRVTFAAVSWFKGSKKLRNSKDFQQTFDGTTASLIIAEIYPDDAGTYRCVLLVGNKELTTEATLTVMAGSSAEESFEDGEEVTKKEVILTSPELTVHDKIVPVPAVVSMALKTGDIAELPGKSKKLSEGGVAGEVRHSHLVAAVNDAVAPSLLSMSTKAVAVAANDVAAPLLSVSTSPTRVSAVGSLATKHDELPANETDEQRSPQPQTSAMKNVDGVTVMLTVNQLTATTENAMVMVDKSMNDTRLSSEEKVCEVVESGEASDTVAVAAIRQKSSDPTSAAEPGMSLVALKRQQIEGASAAAASRYAEVTTAAALSGACSKGSDVACSNDGKPLKIPPLKNGAASRASANISHSGAAPSKPGLSASTAAHTDLAVPDAGAVAGPSPCSEPNVKSKLCSNSTAGNVTSIDSHGKTGLAAKMADVDKGSRDLADVAASALEAFCPTNEPKTKTMSNTHADDAEAREHRISTSKRFSASIASAHKQLADRDKAAPAVTQLPQGSKVIAVNHNTGSRSSLIEKSVDGQPVEASRAYSRTAAHVNVSATAELYRKAVMDKVAAPEPRPFVSPALLNVSQKQPSVLAPALEKQVTGSQALPPKCSIVAGSTAGTAKDSVTALPHDEEVSAQVSVTYAAALNDGAQKVHSADLVDGAVLSTATHDAASSNCATTKEVGLLGSTFTAQPVRAGTAATDARPQLAAEQADTNNNYMDIKDENELQKILDKTEDFDERKKIRARIRELKETRKAERDSEWKRREEERVAQEKKRLAEAELDKKKKLEKYREFSKSSIGALPLASDEMAKLKITEADQEKKRNMEISSEISASTSFADHGSKADQALKLKLEAAEKSKEAALKSYDSVAKQEAERKKEQPKAAVPQVALKQVDKKQAPGAGSKSQGTGAVKVAPPTGKGALAAFKQMDKANNPTAGQSKPKFGGDSKLMQVADALLRWCRFMTKGYEHISIENYTTSWNDGMAFCALIHHFYPDAFDYSTLDPKNRRHNFTLAFETAEKRADISALLDVEDMVRMMKPDWKCVLTYIQTFYSRIKEIEDSKGQPSTAAAAAATSADIGSD